MPNFLRFLFILSRLLIFIMLDQIPRQRPVHKKRMANAIFFSNFLFFVRSYIFQIGKEFLFFISPINHTGGSNIGSHPAHIFRSVGFPAEQVKITVCSACLSSQTSDKVCATSAMHFPACRGPVPRQSPTRPDNDMTELSCHGRAVYAWAGFQTGSEVHNVLHHKAVQLINSSLIASLSLRASNRFRVNFNLKSTIFQILVDFSG